jgi:hypothetical protein
MVRFGGKERLVAGRPTKEKNVQQDDRVKRAYGIMSEVRAALYQRLAEFVLQNAERIRAETLGEESYSFCLSQVEEQFLNKLNVIERAVAELGRGEQREGTPMTTTYETIEVVAKREDLPQKVADALAEHGDSDLLDVCVLRADERQAEVLLIMAREDALPAESAEERAEGTNGDSDET